MLPFDRPCPLPVSQVRRRLPGILIVLAPGHLLHVRPGAAARDTAVGIGNSLGRGQGAVPDTRGIAIAISVVTTGDGVYP